MKEQFEQLKSIRQGYALKPFEVLNDKIIKRYYYRQNNNLNGVTEKCHEFYVEDKIIVEKTTERDAEFAFFSKDIFVLPEGINFSDPIKENYTYHENIFDLAFRFGQEFHHDQSKLNLVKWKPLNEIVKEIEYVLLQGAGFRGLRRADTASFYFQDENYHITYSSDGYIVNDKKEKAYKTASELVLSIGLHKFQFGIYDNGGG
jgi:hypothetical protein